MEKQQVKNKNRVAKYCEVFTAEREINAMLDLVKSETESIDSRFLEPACGGANFFVEILGKTLNYMIMNLMLFWHISAIRTALAIS